MRVFELVLAGILFLAGVRSAVRTLREPPATGTPGTRLLFALHDAAAAGFWLSLSAIFAGYALIEEPQRYRWFVMLPIGMASLRLAAAALLARDR